MGIFDFFSGRRKSFIADVDFVFGDFLVRNAYLKTYNPEYGVHIWLKEQPAVAYSNGVWACIFTIDERECALVIIIYKICHGKKYKIPLLSSRYDYRSNWDLVLSYNEDWDTLLNYKKTGMREVMLNNLPWFKKQIEGLGQDHFSVH